jgi:DNA modification methylase
MRPTVADPYYEDDLVTLHHGDAQSVAVALDPGSVRTIVTSPPYFGLRDYGEAGQIGAEETLQEYVDRLVGVFRALRDVLTDDGTLWLNLGDSYASTTKGSGGGSGKSTLGVGADGTVRISQSGRDRGVARQGFAPRRVDTGLPDKNLLGVPWRVAFALQADGWVLRSDIIWAKPNPMPESVTDRPTKSHEYMFFLAKSPRYYYDAEAIAEGAVKETRNKRTVWSTATVPFPGSHFAVYPPELIRPCILAGSAPGDTVLDPFSGSGTTGMVATQEGRRYIGIDLNRDYLDMSLRTRFVQPVLNLEEIA